MATETITVMFTDLVGSTELLSRLGEDAADVLRREHFELLRSAIAGRGGREVKNLGDGLMVVFRSAADAVAAGVEAQRALGRRNRRSAQPLSIRVGIAAGDADVDGDDYFGMPVVAAARLCDHAAGDVVLATDLVRLLAGSRGGLRFESVGELDLRGLEQPVPACEVVWQTDADAPPPDLPARLAAAASDLFVGRDVERGQLATAWKAAAADEERRVVLVSGEPGIGKTTLAAQLASEVHADGAAVAYGRCEDDAGIPYQPWIEALVAVAAGVPGELPPGDSTARDGTLLRLLPDLAGRHQSTPAGSDDGGAGRFALFAAVIDLLERASVERPLLLVIDDLHWADRPTLQLLRHLVCSGRSLRMMVVGTYRDTDIGAGHPLTELLADLHRERGVDRIALRGFGDADLLALLERMAGHEMPEEGIAVRDAVLAETAGNPFFVLEILRHLADTGAITQGPDGRWRDSGGVRSAGLPVSVKEVVGRRVGALGESAERVLALASVIGRDFDIGLLSVVADLGEDEVIDCCDAAVDAAVLETTDEPERYSFAHALIAHTLYDGLSPARRTRAHRTIAEHLEASQGPDPAERAGELAHHWAAAVQPTDAGQAVHYALLAARHASDQLAPDEALRWYGKALSLLDRGVGDERSRCEALVGLGIAERQCGRAEYRRTLLDAADLADRIDAVDLLVRGAAANTREFSSVIGGIDEERVAVLERALARVGDGDPAGRARLLVVLAMERTYRAPLTERLALVDEAVALARRSGDDRTLVQVLQRSSDAATVPWTLERRIAWATEASELGEELGDLDVVLNARVDLMIAALEAGDAVGMRTCAAEVDDLVRRIPQPALRWVVAMHHAMLTLLGGDLAAAEREIEAAYALAVDTGQPDPLGVYGPQLTNLRYYQGRSSEMRPLLEDIVAGEHALPAHAAALAVGRCLEGDVDGARSLLDAARSEGFAIPEDQGWGSAHVSWAETAARVGDRDAAAVLHEHLRPFASHIVTTNVTVQPSVAHHLGLLDHILGRLDDAERWFQHTMELHQHMASPLFVAATEAAWAALAADRGEDDRARSLASAALDTATARGYPIIAADARTVLRA